jgi:hypothetical protein
MQSYNVYRKLHANFQGGRVKLTVYFMSLNLGKPNRYFAPTGLVAYVSQYNRASPCAVICRSFRAISIIRLNDIEFIFTMFCGILVFYTDKMSEIYM